MLNRTVERALESAGREVHRGQTLLKKESVDLDVWLFRLWTVAE